MKRITQKNVNNKIKLYNESYTYKTVHVHYSIRIIIHLNHKYKVIFYPKHNDT